MEKRITRETVEGLHVATAAAFTAVENLDAATACMWAHVDDVEARIDSMEGDALTQRLERLSHELYRAHRELADIAREVWP